MLKKIFRKILKSAVIALLLLAILFLLLAIPAVQTLLGKYATEIINDDFNTNINIEKVGLQINGDIELKNIYIEDYKKDTLVSVTELNTSIISFKNLYQGKLVFGDLDLYGVVFNLKTYKDEPNTNMDVFVAKFDDDQPTKKKGNFLLSSSDVTINDGVFNLIDENKNPNEILKFNDLNINATNFLIQGPDVSMRINKLAFTDARGVKVKNFQANFGYTRSEMNFENLSIETQNSILNGNLKFMYAREDLQYFVDKVELEANFDDSKISLNELNKFYNEFGTSEVAYLSTNLSGTLNNLNANYLSLKTSRQTQIQGNINFKNLFSKKENDFVMDASFNKLASNYRDLKALFPNVLGNSLPSSLENLNNFNIVGVAKIEAKNIEADVEIETDLGYIYADLDLKKVNDIDAASYTGKIVFDSFKVGEYINDSRFGPASFDLKIEGKGFTLEKLNSQIKGIIYGLEYNNYYYTDIDVEGIVKNKVFNGFLATKDENIDFNFDGLINFTDEQNQYDFTADIKHANLKELNFVTNDTMSVFKGQVTMDMTGTTLDNASGNISFKNTLYRNEYDDYIFKDFQISSQFKNNVRYINVNSPDIIEGSLSGKFKIADIGKLLENALGNIYTNYQAYDVEKNQFIDFNFKIYNKIVEVFYPDISIGKNTFFKGRLESNAKKFNLTFKSPKISYANNFGQNIQLQLNNQNPLFNTYIEVDSLSTKFYNLSNFNLINVTLNDTLFVKTEFNGGKSNKDFFDLNLYYTINEESNSVAGFTKSKIKFKENDWFINKNNNSNNKIEFDRSINQIIIDDMVMNHIDEEIKLTGKLRDSTLKDIQLDFKNVDFNKIVPELDNFTFGGIINGNLSVLQNDSIYLPKSKLTIDDFSLNDYNLGAFRADIKGNESLTNYVVDIGLKDSINESLKVAGNLNVSSTNPSIDLNINFKQFILDPLNPLGKDVISEIRGIVDGNVQVSGDLKLPQITGQLTLNKTGLAIPYLNINYQFKDNSIVDLQSQSFIFNNVSMYDTEYNSEALLTGTINHTNFSYWALDLNILSNRLLVLNTQYSEDALYYGSAFVKGNININGPTDALVIKAEVSTEKGTIFNIPLNDTNTFGADSYIYFLSADEKNAKEKGQELAYEDIKGLEMDFDLSINENAEVEIVMDREAGSTIKGKGVGGLLAQINTKGKFNMYGDLIVTQGIYNFVWRKLVRKKFEVLQGGTLVWEGDPMKAEINIKAIHQGITANPSVLLDNPINQSIPVVVEVNLTEQLEKPNLDFDIRFPSVNTALNTELKDRLRDKDNRDLQAISLLTTGAFRSEFAFNSNDVYGIVSDGISNMLNEIISDDNDKLNINLNWDPGETRPEYETDSRFVASVTTKINDNILINGNVGVPVGGVNQSTVAGDFEVEVLLNEDRTLSLKFFNRENSIQYFGEQIGYTQGVGISYNVEFDNLRELLNQMFAKKNEDPEQEKKVSKPQNNALPEYMNFKDSVSTKTSELEKK